MAAWDQRPTKGEERQPARRAGAVLALVGVEGQQDEGRGQQIFERGDVVHRFEVADVDEEE